MRRNLGHAGRLVSSHRCLVQWCSGAVVLEGSLEVPPRCGSSGYQPEGQRQGPRSADWPGRMCHVACQAHPACPLFSHRYTESPLPSFFFPRRTLPGRGLPPLSLWAILHHPLILLLLVPLSRSLLSVKRQPTSATPISHHPCFGSQSQVPGSHFLHTVPFAHAAAQRLHSSASRSRRSLPKPKKSCWASKSQQTTTHTAHRYPYTTHQRKGSFLILPCPVSTPPYRFSVDARCRTPHAVASYFFFLLENLLPSSLLSSSPSTPHEHIPPHCRQDWE